MRLITPLTPERRRTARSASLFWKPNSTSPFLERHPALADRHVHFVSRNSGIPPQGVEHGFGQVGVGAFRKAGQAHLDLVGDRLDATRAVGDLLGSHLFQIGIDPARQRDDPVLDDDADFVGLHAWIPLQFFQDICLDLFIRPDANGHRSSSFP
jgi:hypothetical protein